jgi:biopolymer transport protein ExbB
MEFSSDYYGFMHFLQNLNAISFSVLSILLVMSIISWYLIITKTFQLGFVYWRSNKILNLFWTASSLEPLFIYLSRTKFIDPASNLALQGINAAIYYEKRATKQQPNLCSQGEFLSRNLRRAINESSAHLESNLTTLATIGSTAPFVGLLGTVLGIYDALIVISVQGNASLDTVAAPVGEALIMTAIGLAVAIPAVLAYNIFIRNNRRLFNQLEGFTQDLHTCLNTGARIDMKNLTYIINTFNYESGLGNRELEIEN